jgi:ferredoxin
MEQYFLRESAWLALVQKFPKVVGSTDPRGFRSAEPLKSVVFPVSEKVSPYFGTEAEYPGRPVVIVGARSCDLEALVVYDQVLATGELADPFYQARRNNLIIISADCTDCGQTCFCTMVNGQPFPKRGFDLNFSPVESGYIVAIGTSRGEQIVKEDKNLFELATAEQLKERDKNRKQMTDQVQAQNQEFTCRCNISWTEAHKINLQNQTAWKQITKNCVECSSCNLVCPSCSCFLLLDQPENGRYGRYKVWDACLKNGYAKVAGGANSRPKLFERLQNRYHCKFDYSFERLGRYTCVGCGRCIDGCAANIDMRRVYAELVKQVPLTAKLE